MATQLAFALFLDDTHGPDTTQATYFLGTCKRCHRTHRTTAEATKVYGTLRYVPCKPCSTLPNAKGVLVEVRPIQATYHAATRCGAKCQLATGPSCECSCNGRNHGGRH